MVKTRFILISHVIPERCGGEVLKLLGNERILQLLGNERILQRGGMEKHERRIMENERTMHLPSSYCAELFLLKDLTEIFNSLINKKKREIINNLLTENRTLIISNLRRN